MTTPQTPPPSARAWALLLLLAAIWGGSFFFNAVALREVPTMTLVAHRVVWGAAALWLYVVLCGPALPKLSLPLLGAWGLMGVLNNAVPFTLIVWGQTQIESGLASIFNAMTAILGVLVAALFLRDERLTAAKLGGTGLGLFGVATIIGLEALETLDLRQLGQLAILGATLSYAFASVWGRVQLAGVPPVLNAAGMLTASSLLVVPLALRVDGAPEVALSGAVWGSILGLGILATAVAYLLYFEIMRLSGAANTMLVTLLIPPFALMLGWAFLDETVSTRSLVGFALIALGLAVIDGRPFRRSAATV